MTRSSEPLSALEHYSLGYQDLFHDRRLFKGFQATLSGILSSGSTRVRQIARAAPQTGCTPHSERRFRRLIHAQPQRADLSLETLEAHITARGAERLAGQSEVRVLLDGSNLRKPHSTSLEYLSTVRALDGDLIPGYPTLNAVGVGSDGQQALLYHHTYSSLESDFKSEGAEVKKAIEAVTRALRQVGVGRITWILDRGFDDAKVIAWLLESHACFIIRAQHNRKVRSTPSGKFAKLFETVQAQPPLGTLEMLRPVQENGKRKKRLVPAVTRSTQVWLSEPFTPLGVVNLQFQAHSYSDPNERGWVLLTNLPLESDRDAKHIVALYASRWAIEEIFAWTKTALEWEAARVLSFDAFKRLVALAWIAAAFLFELELHLEPRFIEHLAFLGGWTPRANASPGKKVLALGLSRYFSFLLVQDYSSRMQPWISSDTLNLEGPE